MAGPQFHEPSKSVYSPELKGWVNRNGAIWRGGRPSSANPDEEPLVQQYAQRAQQAFNVPSPFVGRPGASSGEATILSKASAGAGNAGAGGFAPSAPQPYGELAKLLGV